MEPFYEIFSVGRTEKVGTARKDEFIAEITSLVVRKCGPVLTNLTKAKIDKILTRLGCSNLQIPLSKCFIEAS